MTNLEDVTRQLTDVAWAVGSVLLEMQDGALGVRLKGPAQVVTAADERSHEMMVAELSRRFPGVPMVLEEQENPVVLPSRYLVADELDGTAIYACGLSDWGVTLALVEGGQPVAGVLHQPIRGETVAAWRGGGAWRNGGRVHLNPGLSVADSVALVEFNRFLDADAVVWLDRLARQSLTLRALGTAVGAAIEMLAGHASVYLNCQGAKVWDFAAAAVAVAEAGGVAVALNGSAPDWSVVPQGVLFAANPAVAAEVLRLRKVAAPL
jgi:fructose-1,6-bisphosphatase/inositol monophosphatase family enzyme